MVINDWDKLSSLEAMRSVLDPNDEKGSKNLLIDQMHWNVLRKHLKTSRCILDFGCGIGRYTKRIIDLGKEYHGIDTSMGMIQKAVDLHGNKYFKHFNGIRIPFPNSYFDAVITTEVLTYLIKTPSGAIAFSEIHRVLKPEGRLIMLEQASLSNRKSESATSIIVEDDYRKELANSFTVEHLYKVRSPDFSALTCKILDSPKVPFKIFRYMVPCVAKHEFNLVAKAPDDYFRTTSYYDFLIEAKVIK